MNVTQVREGGETVKEQGIDPGRPSIKIAREEREKERYGDLGAPELALPEITRNGPRLAR